MKSASVHWQTPPDIAKIVKALYEVAYPDYEFTVKITPKEKEKKPERETD